ncbi:diaminopimelate decarboxylase family protein [Kitasatospora sp. NPDC096147]|uniref:diaminopimelate decarboxylase family protein n=1 Tax=Kitasatospora sp. NPDC096147 TaxID=3364093 RepID=UPI00382ACD17
MALIRPALAPASRQSLRPAPSLRPDPAGGPAPSLRPAPVVRPPDGCLSVWPSSARTAPGGDIAVGGVPLASLAEQYGTPVHVLDEGEVRERCRTYRSAFPEADVVYAAKAFLCRAVAQWVRDEGLGLEVCSARELGLAVEAGFPAERIVMHGRAGGPEDLRAAVRHGVGRIVIDSTAEIARLAALVPPGGRQQVLLRVVPGVATAGPAAVRDGTEDRASGLSVTDGSARHAVARVLARPQLRLVGLHCHIGSQIDSVKPYQAALRRMIGLMAKIRDQYGVELPQLDLGGGHAIAHRPGETALDLPALARRVRAELADGCARVGLSVPRLTLEPGRAVTGPAGVTVHRVLAVEQRSDHTVVAVDGGTGELPGPDLHGVRHTARLIGRHTTAARRQATVVVRRSEAGQVLAADVSLPSDLRPGDLLAVPAVGAYHLPPAAADSPAGRTPVVAVAEGRTRVLVHREPPSEPTHGDAGR